MKRRHLIALVAAGLITGLFAAGILVVGQTKVPPNAIASSVTRTPELLERAWGLPVAATFDRQLTWQSNGSRCGPAAVANINRSLKEPATTEAEVLSGTGRCWIGVCILGLTLDELADVARHIQAARSLSCATLRKNNFASTCVGPTIPGDATS